MNKQDIIKKMENEQVYDLVEYFQNFEENRITQLTDLSITTGDISYYFLVDYIATKNSDWRFYSLASNMLFSDYIHIPGAGDLSYIKLRQAISLNPDNLELYTQVLSYWKFPDATIPLGELVEALNKLDKNVDSEIQSQVDILKRELRK